MYKIALILSLFYPTIYSISCEQKCRVEFNLCLSGCMGSGGCARICGGWYVNCILDRNCSNNLLHDIENINELHKYNLSYNLNDKVINCFNGSCNTKHKFNTQDTRDTSIIVNEYNFTLQSQCSARNVWGSECSTICEPGQTACCFQGGTEGTHCFCCNFRYSYHVCSNVVYRQLYCQGG